MRRRTFLGASSALGLTAAGAAQAELPGIWRFRLGTPEEITPVRVRRTPPADLSRLPAVDRCPVAVSGSVSRRGCLVRIPLQPNEMVYGLGLTLQSFMQRGLKKLLRVNADPAMDSGDSHAPVPFYVTTQGYGVLVDTARNITVYAGNKRRKPDGAAPQPAGGSADGWNGLPNAYARYRIGEASEVLIEVPRAEGVDVWVFGGPGMREAVQRYNLFSGGGVLPPRWGLGVHYRVKNTSTQADVERMAAELRREAMPCDVLGLEPGWQTHAYSCSYVWDGKFPDPDAMIGNLRRQGFRVSLWEHAFVHRTSPIREALETHSGDYVVWDGLVPDFLTPEAREIFGGYHRAQLVRRGIAAFKLDECDNSDFTGNWSFPDMAEFPSGADGEQMHNLFGLAYQQAILAAFEERTYGLCRSSGALAAASPFVLYSDLYDHRQFLRGMAAMGFSGLLWTPELRHAASPEDLVRRLETVALSPMALINGWYIAMPPWKQVSRALNNQGQLAADWERTQAACRKVLELRMQLIPYLHAAFVEYQRTGLPPFRALVMDWPGDPATFVIDDQYMMGASLMVAPAVAGQKSRTVYLPRGVWFDFWTGARLEGGRRMEVEAPLSRVPLFVPDGALLALAATALHVEDAAGQELTVHAYGARSSATVLYEDDGKPRPDLNEVTIRWDAGASEGSLHKARASTGYRIRDWKRFL